MIATYSGEKTDKLYQLVRTRKSGFHTWTKMSQIARPIAGATAGGDYREWSGSWFPAFAFACSEWSSYFGRNPE